MDRDRTITARFDEGVLLTLDVFGDGDVVVDPDLEVYEVGAEVTLRAVPVGDATFLGWGGDVSAVNSSITFTLDESMSIDATFSSDSNGSEPEPGQSVDPDPIDDPETATLTVAIEGSGVVTPPGGNYALGARLTLIATPGIGSSFVRWEDAATGTDLTAELTMTSDHRVVAVFTGGDDPTGQPVPDGSGAGQVCGALGLGGLATLGMVCVSLPWVRVRRSGRAPGMLREGNSKGKG